MTVLRDALQTACRNAEPDFLKIGQELRSVKADTDLMTQKIHAAVDFIKDAIEREALQRVRELSKKSMADVKSIRQGAHRNLRHIIEVADSMGAINRLCNGTETITTFLRVISFNMAVKSAHSRNAEETFKGFAEEAKKVADNFSVITGQLGHDAQMVQTAQLAAHEEIMADSDLLEDLAIATDNALENAVNASEQLMSHARNVLQNASMHSQTIAQQISEIVVNIQFHDNMNQRIADICNNLSHIRIHPEDKPNNDKVLRFNQADSYLNNQSSELHLIITELDDIYHKNKQAFEKIESDSELLAQSIDIYNDTCLISDDLALSSTVEVGDDFQTQQTEPHDPFISLQDALESLHDVLCKGQKLTEEIEKSVTYAIEKTLRFAKQARKVHRIGYEAHIMALNAGVKSSKLANQRQTFAVMAHEITSLARQSQAFVADIEKILQSVGTLNMETQKSLSEQAAMDQAGAITMVDDRFKAVSNAFNQFKTISADACQLAGILRQKIGNVKTGLFFLPTLADELTDFKQFVDILSRIAKEWKNKARELTDQEIESLVQECRTEFEQAVDTQPDIRENSDFLAETPVNQSSPAFLAEDDLGDNIELF